MTCAMTKTKGQVVYPQQWMNRTGFEEQIFADEPFPGAGFRLISHDPRSKSRPLRRSESRRRISPASAAKLLCEVVEAATSLGAMILYFICALVVFFAQNL